jgi:glycosyltransferase involved in cell wall biosynthesis
MASDETSASRHERVPFFRQVLLRWWIEAVRPERVAAHKISSHVGTRSADRRDADAMLQDVSTARLLDVALRPPIPPTSPESESTVATMLAPSTERRLRILVISWNYPTAAAPRRGLWVERMCEAAAKEADVRVIVPTPWVPPLVPVPKLSRFRTVPQRERRRELDLYFPRVPGSVEYLTHAYDARLAMPSVLATARRLHAERPFDLIHAHFVYPDGVVAASVGRALGIPVMTSEHAFWTPWLDDRPGVGDQVRRALPRIALVTAVSAFLREGIDAWTHGRVPTDVLPNVVDDEVFTLGSRDRDRRELLYVGLIRRVKRVDVLLRALAELRRTNPELHLRIIASNAHGAYYKDWNEVRTLIPALGLEDAVRIEQGKSPAEVAEAMRRCGLVAVTSTRRETFCAVAAEALACGTPLVTTRCGGPEEFVTPEDGVMAPADDPAALADGIRQALDHYDRFDGAAIRERIVERFGRAAWTRRAMSLYDRVVSGHASTLAGARHVQ